MTYLSRPDDSSPNAIAHHTKSFAIIVLVILSMAGLPACSAIIAAEGIEPTDLSKVQLGASRKEVDGLLGKPKNVVANEAHKFATYRILLGRPPDPPQASSGSGADLFSGPAHPGTGYLVMGVLFVYLMLQPYLIAKAYEDQDEGHLTVVYDRDDKVVWFEGGELSEEQAAESVKALKAAEHGDRDAQYQVAMRTGTPEGRWTWLCRAAHGGHAGARNLLGKAYFEGAPPVEKDLTRAHMWLTLAGEPDVPSEATAVNVAAQMSPEQIAESERLARAWHPDSRECMVADLPRIALSPKQREKEAKRQEKRRIAMLQHKAEGGEAEVAYALTDEQELTGERLRWMCVAAHHGHAKARNYIAARYAAGEALGEKRDDAKAYLWYGLAAADGDAAAAKALQELRSRMTPDQISAAKRSISSWKPDVGSCVRPPFGQN